MAKSNGRTVATKIKTAVMLSPEAFRRLGAACLAEDLGQSEIVEQLINRALSGYVVSVRGPGFRAGQATPHTSNDRPSEAPDVNLAAVAAA